MLINYDNDNDDHGHNTGQLLTYILTNIANMLLSETILQPTDLSVFWEWVDNQTYIYVSHQKYLKL